jgi:hypothetical protein
MGSIPVRGISVHPQARMCWFHRSILACLAWWVLASSCPGAPLPASLASPPPDGLADGGGFFSRDVAARKRICDSLGEMEKRHGYRIYVVVEPVLLSGTPQELAVQLRQAWLPDGNGLVIVFESDSGNLGFGSDVETKPGMAVSNAVVPTHETAALLQSALSATDMGLAREIYLETLVGNIVREFNGYFARRAAPPPAGRSLRFALLTTGVLALLALGAIGIGALSRMQAVAGTRVFRIPPVDRPERLGAPCGGEVVSRSFRQRD